MGGDHAFERLLSNGDKICFHHRGARNKFLQRFTIKKLHHDEGTIVVPAYVEDSNNMSGLQAGEDTTLTHQLIMHILGVDVFLRMQTFDRNVTVQLLIIRQINGSKSSFREFFFDLVTLIFSGAFHDELWV